MIIGGRRLDRRAVTTGGALALLGVIGLVEGFVLGSQPDANRLNQTLVPGMYVQLVGGVVLLSGVAHLWRHAGVVRTDADGGQATTTWGATLPVLVALGVYVLLIDYLSYLLATPPFFIAVLRIFGVRSWRQSVGLGFLLTAAFWLVFVFYLNVRVPRGFLEGLI